VVFTNITSTNKISQCYPYNGNHALRVYNKFQELPVIQKQEQARKSEACYNCRGVGHSAAVGQSQKWCRYCQEKYNTLFHVDSGESMNTQTTSHQTHDKGAVNSKANHVVNMMNSTYGTILLATVRVKLISDSDR